GTGNNGGNNGGGGAGGGGGNAGNPGSGNEAPLLLPIGPAGFTSPVTTAAGAPVPQLTDVGNKPVTDYRFVVPPVDPFSPGGAERVKGVVEEAPKNASAMNEAAADKPVGANDDCPPVFKKVAAPKPKAQAVKPSVFAKPAMEAPKTFSEQLKAATKRLKPPAKVAPVPVRTC
nr:hypothetical protein [Burkholderiaceae bacterium]